MSLGTVMGGSIWGVLADKSDNTRSRKPKHTYPHNIIEKNFPSIFSPRGQMEIETLITPQMMRVRLKKEIDELEEEIDGYDYGSYQYDVVDGELQYLYARLSRLS